MKYDITNINKKTIEYIVEDVSLTLQKQHNWGLLLPEHTFQKDVKKMNTS